MNIGAWFGRRSGIREAAAVLAVASLVSRLFGVVRDSVIASHYAGDISDAYIAAFVIPDFIYNLLILGALSSAFIPVFTDYLQKNGDSRDEAWAIVNSLLNIGVVILAVVLLVGVILAPSLVGLVAPGFAPEKQAMVVDMMRVMFLSPLFFGLSNLAGGILNSFKNFLAYSIAPIFYNVGIIIGALYLVPQFGYLGLAYGVVGGAVMHMLIQLPGVFSLGYKYRMHVHWDHPALRRIAGLMIPRTLGVAIAQINVVVNVAIASHLDKAAVSIFKWADNLQSLPIGIFGVSFAVAIFPTLAERYSLRQIDDFRADVVQVLRQLIFFVVPTMMLYWLLRAQIVRLVLGYGEFGWDYTRFTASALAFFTFGILAQCLIQLLARSFYALQDTKTPLITSMVALGINVVMALVLVEYFGIVGLAGAVSCAAIVNAGILLVLLSMRIGAFPWKNIANLFLRVVVASGALAVAGYGLLRAMDLIIDTHTFWGILTQTLVTTMVAGLAFLAVAKLLGVEEVELFMKPLKFFKRNRKWQT